MERMTISRRNFLNLAVGTAAGAALAACGSSGPQSSTSGGGNSGAGAASYWFLTGQPGEGIREDAVDRFNKANPDTQITPTEFQNDAYKTKIKTAIGAGQGPTMIWGWGGGGLKSYVDADQVEDLTDWFGQNAAVKDRLFPSSFGAATVDGKIYAMPAETVQPIVLYYNKRLFEKVGVQPPKSWGDIMALVPKFNAQNIAPFSLGGQSRWTNMMWLEFLLDRHGRPRGLPERLRRQGRTPGPTRRSLDMLTKVQDLVKANGFIKGFSSITADSNADQALLYTGKAAMMLHGGWTYGSMNADGGDFVSGGSLGYMNFPPVEGGKGDPSNTVGNPGQYLSISSKATAEQKETAKKFFSTAVLSDDGDEGVDRHRLRADRQGHRGADSPPPTDADFLKFVYDTSANAKTFAQSWDQALSPTAAETLLDNIAKLFQLQISPQQWVDSMNGVIGK